MMIEQLVVLILVVVLVGVLLYAFQRLVPLQSPFKEILLVVVVVILILWLIRFVMQGGI